MNKGCTVQTKKGINKLKNYFLVLVSIFTLSFATALNAQDDVATKAFFNGFDGESYSFTTIAKENEDAKTMRIKEGYYLNQIS